MAGRHYKNGYGVYNSNFWLGLEKMHQMTNAGYKFRMEVLSTDGLWFSAEYDSFSLASETNQYTLSIAGYSGDTGDIFLDSRDVRQCFE